MEMFERFEKIVSRLKNKRTREKAIYNLIFFFLVAGSGSLLAVYMSTYVNQKAGEAARDPDPPSIRTEYQIFTGRSTLFAVAKKGMSYSPINGFETGARWWKNDVLITAESLIDFLAIRAERHGSLPNDVFWASVTDPSGKPVHEETYYSHDQYSTENRSVSGAADPTSKFFGLPTTKMTSPRIVDMKIVLQTASTSSGLRIFANEKDWTDPQIEALGYNRYWVGGFAPYPLIADRIDDKWTSLIVAKNPVHSDLVRYHAYFFHENYVAHIESRQLRLLTLCIENIGDRPIYAPELFLKRLPGILDGTLRTERQQRDSFAKTKAKPVSLPLDALKPGERLYIPLHLFMEFADKQRPVFPDWRGHAGNFANFKLLQGFTAEGLDISEIITIDVSELKKRPPEPEVQNQRYFFGPAVEILQLKIGSQNGSEVPIRSFDPLNIVLQDGVEKGSCPVLFTVRGGRPIRIRPILINAVGQSSETMDKIGVSSGFDTFELRELEQERSFISSIQLVVELDDGTEIRYQTDVPVITGKYSYFVLDQGQQLSFKFSTSHNLEHEKSRRLEISGYYVPHALVIDEE
jgi:hypothetical protein